MSRLRELVRSFARDASLDVAEVERLRLEVGDEVTRAEVAYVLEAYGPILTPDAERLLRAIMPRPGLGELVTAGLRRLRGDRDVRPGPPGPLFHDPALAEVRSRRATLGAGASGPAVKRVQQVLMLASRLSGDPTFMPAGGVTGTFDLDTVGAVAHFQELYDLPASGRVDQDTLRTLDAALEALRPLVPARPTHLELAADGTLRHVIGGEVTVGRGASGVSVAALQRALISCGFDPPGGADGIFGPGTEAAVRGMQRSLGLPPTGVVDARTLAGLDRVMPAPGHVRELAPEYDRLFAGGVMEVTVGVGYDEDGADLELALGLWRDLAGLGFTRVDPTSSESQLSDMGVSRIREGVEVWHRTVFFGGAPVQVVVRVVTRSTPAAVEAFEEGLVRSDVVFYAGHARLGTGPDFDAVESPDGNYVVDARSRRSGGARAGRKTLREVVATAEHSLARTPFVRDQYQLVILSGCRTQDYLAALRAVPGAKDSTNLDVIVTKARLDVGDVRTTVRELLGGLAETAPLSTLLARADPAGRLLRADGFADNRPVR